ncbi:hypothetical protein C4D60_Mb04t17760 [Musa balbisiana]|uniref:Uncharacterized protein n=1 Tax=Musa balbisiana TaxID=52838 RepID=A0A4S8KCR3_MUSBA|nr:hypothetical protein C4D60_Mb04t17760 [Musa balbisiana]
MVGGRSVCWSAGGTKFGSEATFRPSSSIQHHRRNRHHTAYATTGAGNYTGAGEKQIDLERDVVEGCAGSRTERQKNCKKSPRCRKYAGARGRGGKAAES